MAHYIPTSDERIQRDIVIAKILDHIREGRTIRLPIFDASLSGSDDDYALLSIALEDSTFSGSYGPYRYQFEGEDDLLHLMVVRQDLSELTVEEAQVVAAFLLPCVPPALVWLKPGKRSQHFYLGHDVLLEDGFAS